MIRVLLIEDNSEDIVKIRKALSSSEHVAFLDTFEFFLANSLAKGLEVLKSAKIDVILLDLGLPDTKGFGGIDRLKQEVPFIPIVVLTKQREETLVAIEAVKHGAQDYFSKSYLGEAYSLDRIVRYAIERKKLEEDLVAAREEAVRSSRAKSEFLSNMSHDIRTPLNCIVGVADLLSRAKLSEENSNYIKMLNKASDNLLSLINNILDLSKIEAGQLKIGSKPFDLLETIEGVLDICSPRAHAKNLELILNMGAEIPRYLIGDPENLTQILVNFLANAVKFTNAGEIVLSIAHFPSQDRRAHLQFMIKDSGVGIPSDKLDSIFESFTQVVPSETGLTRQGSGLGLSICKRLIELMNGKVSVQSEVGKGSAFQFEISFECSKHLGSYSAVRTIDLDKIEILIADDNAAHAMILSEILQSWGGTVHIAQSAQEAAALAKAIRTRGKKFDLAILDLRMPGVAAGGLELAIHLKEDIHETIMMLPTNHRFGDIDRLKAAGIAKYYFKPTKAEKLAELIREILHPEPAALPISTRAKVRARDAKELSLLVVDDSEDNRYLIEAFCKGAGIKLVMAEDGKQAVEKFKKQAFDLVLMDIQMPTMNGYEALSAIRAWEVGQGKSTVPILALTAFALKEESEKCLAAGFGAHVTKPIRKDELLQTIKKHAA